MAQRDNRTCEVSAASAIHQAVDSLNRKFAARREAGSFNGHHYTQYVDEIKQLKREGKNQDAIQLLLKCVDATEAETRFVGEKWGVAPWYYEQLAILYRKQKDYEREISVLIRYSNQSKASIIGTEKLAKRLTKARALIAKQQQVGSRGVQGTST